RGQCVVIILHISTKTAILQTIRFFDLLSFQTGICSVDVYIICIGSTPTHGMTQQFVVPGK
ncbi:MAG: hypothetical protein WCE25_06685, partial [Nitrososphaeraceae archaeon]